MAFVNEYISEDEFQLYGIEQLNQRPKEHSGSTPADTWTIDRDSDIWLRKFYSEMDHTQPDGGYTGVTVWDFYWKGCLMLVKLKEVASGGGYGKPRWARSRLLGINIPAGNNEKRDQIIADLENALSAYRGAGVLAVNDGLDYSFILEK